MNEKIVDENHEFSKINQNSQKILTCKQGKISFYLKVDAGRLAHQENNSKLLYELDKQG